MKSFPALLAAFALCPILSGADFPQILPPPPKAPLSQDQESALASRLAGLEEAFAEVKEHDRSADAAIFLKAVRYALEFDEWYDKKAGDGVKKAATLLDEAGKRIASLEKNQTPWMAGPGWKVLGFYSKIDDSPQPYAVEVPEGLEWGAGKKPVPMWIWLHGRGDTSTDLHFIAGKLNGKKPGQFQPEGTIVIHPFGRYCNGWKSAGETDVFEARDDATARFNVDENRIALAGFSMGGAGAWHIGAHYADQWACVHAGAGFVDVKRYQKLTPEQMPPWYEEKLWGVYDVPVAARNFFNVPLVAYSGEEDKQRDGAEYMQETLAAEGYELKHYIGPGMGHKYHPEVIKQVQAEIEKAVAKGRDSVPKKVVLQCRSHRYAAMHWVEVLECEKPWEETRIEAELVRGESSGNTVLSVQTQNVRAFRVDPLRVSLDGSEVRINGQQVEMTPGNISTSKPEDTFVVDGGQWGVRSAGRIHPDGMSPVKAGGTSLEDALRGRFVIVLPEEEDAHPAVNAWMKAESDRFIRRWRSLMRGDPLVTTLEEIKSGKSDYSTGAVTLVLWGTPETNRLVADLFDEAALHEGNGGPFLTSEQPLPAIWSGETVAVGDAQFDASTHVLCAAYPRGWSTPRGDSVWEPWGSVILNSGLTFREAHDRTNSLQNPKLPDWAILDISVPPDGEQAGKVVAADFFDVQWRVKTK